MKILVTGAAGFIGSHLCEYLADQEHEVIGLDGFTNYYSRDIKELNAKAVQEKGITIYEFDLVENGFKDTFSTDFDFIYHLAAQPGLSNRVSFEEYTRNNLQATANLIDFAKQNSQLKCFINVSTSSVYGREATSKETIAPQPASYYGVTKLAAEQLVLSQQRQNLLNACSIRLYSVYGPRERPEKLYTKLIDCILKDKEFPLYEGSKNHSRSFTFVKDAIIGLAGVISNTEACLGEIINVGSDKEMTTGEGIRIIEELMGKKARFAMQPPLQGDQTQTLAIIDKAKRLLNYNPTTELKEGLEKQVEWYKELFSKYLRK
ncbi:MAG: NAD-dependent epimerase/dehydratase family protein [Bacteroidales bacterium]|jgi:UDP-glucuronate 4-epimerase|nr:NAD-dependent epimerase/dehydratase family protein [Bacteroidales bacterium]